MYTFLFNNMNIKTPWLVQTEGQQEENAVQNSSTVPMVAAAKDQEKLQPKLTQDGNVPLVQNTATNKVEDKTGLAVEQTNQPVSGSNKEKTETDKFFARYYKGWDHFSAEKKQAYAKKYLTQFNESKQGSEFKRLYKNGVSVENIELLGSTLGSLKKGTQVGAANTMLDTEGTLKNKAGEVVAKNVKFLHTDNQLIVMGDVINKSGKEVRISMAREIPNLTVKNQVKATKLIAATKDEDVVNAAAEVSYKTDKKCQVEVAKTLFDTGFEKVQKTIAHNEGKFDKHNQIAIYKTLLTSEHQSVLNEAARNIYTLYKENQVLATKLTVATNNEEAINAAASTAYKCDSKYQEEIKSTLASSGYDSVKETLATSEAESVKETSGATQSTSVSDKIKEITSSNSTMKEDEIKDLLKNASNSEKLAMIQTLPPEMLYLLLENNPSMDVLSKITDVLGQVDDKTQKGLIKQMNNSYSSALLNSRVSLFDVTAQKTFIQEAASNGDLRSINKEKLSGAAKEIYTELLKGQKA